MGVAPQTVSQSPELTANPHMVLRSSVVLSSRLPVRVIVDPSAGPMQVYWVRSPRAR